MSVTPVHPNEHVILALRHLREALVELNMADRPYAIGVRGVDEPYGMVERAIRRVLEHAAPDLDPEEVHLSYLDGESFEYGIRFLRRERRRRIEEIESFQSGAWPDDYSDEDLAEVSRERNRLLAEEAKIPTA